MVKKAVMQQLPLVLLSIALIAVAAVIVHFALKVRKRARRQSYLRNRSARVRQQWADMEDMGEMSRRR